MKRVVLLFGFLLAVVFRVNAQEVFKESQLATLTTSFAGAENGSDLPRAFAVATLVPSPDFPQSGAPSPDGAVPQATTGIDVNQYALQGYVGYTFIHVFARHGEDVSRNGFDISMSYYHNSGSFGLEGALTTTFGTFQNETSNFLFWGGGPRYRWALSQGVELWAHGLIGEAHFGPRVANFTQNAFGYELGTGLDLSPHLRHFAYRLEADMVGTRLYGTGQYSPKFTVGVVYRF
jgi:hypothetical protein